MTTRADPCDSRPAPSFLPSTAVMEVTYRCNLQCLYCSCPWEARDGKYQRGLELDADGWKDCIRKLASMGVTRFAFTGGEPLTRPFLTDLLEFASGLEVEHIETVEGSLRSRVAPPELYLLSNGQRMTEEVLETCRRHGVHLSLSLPGLATYREHTQHGDPETVLGWFRRAKAAGVTTTVNVTVTRKNLHELYETIAEALLAGADTLLLNRFLPGGRGLSHLDALMLSRDEIVEMLDTAEAVLSAAGRTGHVGTELPLCLIDPARYRSLKVGYQCSAARQFFVVGPEGRVRVCNHSPVQLASVDEIEALKDDPYWRRFVFQDYLPSVCGGCGARFRCDGGCREAAHITGGAPTAPDPLMAEAGV